MTRTEKQLELQNLFITSKGIGTLLLCTGFGKTRIALNLCEDLLKRNSKSIINVVVPKLILKVQWEKQIREKKLKNISVFVINSYVQSKHKCDFLIIDEVQRASNSDSEFFSKTIDNTEYKYILCLSGTLEKKHLDFLESKNIPVLATINREQALENGWISDYSIYTLMLQLDEEDRREYNKISKFSSNAFKLNGINRFEDLLLVINGREFCENVAKINNIDKGALIGMCRKAQNAATIRRTMVYNYYKKSEAILELVEKIPVKTIIFGQTIKFAQETTKNINKKFGKELFVCVTSDKEDDKKSKESLRKLKDKRYKIRGVVAAKGLNEGFDDEEIELGIDAAYTSSKVDTGQKIGRSTRKYKDKKAKHIFLCYEDTVEETWLEKNGGLNSSKIVYSVDEILELERLN